MDIAFGNTVNRKVRSLLKLCSKICHKIGYKSKESVVNWENNYDENNISYN